MSRAPGPPTAPPVSAAGKSGRGAVKVPSAVTPAVDVVPGHFSDLDW